MSEISGSMEIKAIVEGGVKFEVRLEHEELSFTVPDRPPAQRLLPYELFVRLREWRRQRTGSRWFGLQVCDDLRALPWAAALQKVLDDDPIAWVVPGQAARTSEPVPVEALRLLLSIWIDPALPGLKKEIDGLAALGDRGIHAVVALSPTADHLQARVSAQRPTILHLAPSGASEHERGSLRYRDSISGELRAIPTHELISWLPPELRLVVINTCHATVTAQEITRSRGLMTIAWADVVSDERAVAFALFFYEQLLRGTSPADAILRFTNQSVSSDIEHRDLDLDLVEPQDRRRESGTRNPVVFISDLASLGLQIVALAEHPRATMTRAGEVRLEVTEQDRRKTDISSLVRGVDRLQIDARDAINPALLINGRETLKAVRIKSEHEIPRAAIEVTCDAGIGVSHVRTMVDLVEGMNSVSMGSFQFPVLYELLRLGVKRRPINFRVRLLADDAVLAEETRSSWWMAQDEWIDSSDTHEFLPAFIDPDCQTVKDLWSSEHERVIALAGTASLDGETASARERVDPYVKALYLILRDKRLKYIQPPPQRIGLRGQRLLGQRVRSPEEVLRHRRGTCHDLALLFAACMEHIRLYPIVVLIPGHTFAGYWRSSKAHTDYWKASGRWQILHKHDLNVLVTEGKLMLLEATSVTDPNDVSFEQACQLGTAHLHKVSKLDTAIDIRASRGFVDTLQ